LLSDGTVEVDKRSPSHCLNEDRYGQAQVLAGANAKPPSQWNVIDKTGRFEWPPPEASLGLRC
jgi:hypothetical protein